MSGATLRGVASPPYCDALVHDTGTHTPSALTKPDYMQNVIDPIFGTMITRVSGNVGDDIPGLEPNTWGLRMMPVYPKMPAWSTPDENGDSLIFIEYTLQTVGGDSGVPLFLDGNTYEPLYLRGGPFNAAHDIERGNRRWHPTLPDVMVEIDNEDATVRFWDVRADTTVAVHDPNLNLVLPDIATFGSGEGNMSLDGRYVVVTIGPEGGTENYFYVLDLANCVPTPTPGSAVKLTDDILLSTMGIASMDWVSVSPLGNYIVASEGASETGVFEWDRVSGEVNTTRISNFTSGHFDLVVGQDGIEYALDGLGRYVDLRTGVRTTIWNNGSGHYHIGTHVGSGLAGVRGWGIASTYQSEGTAANELIAYNPNGAFYRLCHHRMSDAGGNVSGSPCAIPSPDGRRILFASDWGDTATNFSQAYILDVSRLCG